MNEAAEADMRRKVEGWSHEESLVWLLCARRKDAAGSGQRGPVYGSGMPRLFTWRPHHS